MTPAPDPRASRFAQRHPKAYLWLHGVIGLLLAAGCAYTFVAIAEDLPEQGVLVQTDVAVTQWLQTHGTEFGESVFSVVSLFGAQILSALLIGIAVFLTVRRRWRPLVMLLVTAGGGALINVLLKFHFHRQRPVFASEFHLTSWSFPSGHAMDSLIGYGLLGYWLAERLPQRRRIIIIATAFLIGLIGYSRVYLGVHYLSDVGAGFSAGAVWLMVCISGYRFAERRGVGTSGDDGR